MSWVALKNPIAVLMVSIALIVFAIVVVPRMSVDTFPELTPPVLVVGTQCPGLGPKDVEKTITWRIEKNVSAVPGIDHVESVSKNNLSIVYVWLKWGTDLNAAQVLVQQQTAFAMSSVPKSLGVLPPFVLQYDPANAPVIQVAVSGATYSGAQLYDYAQNNIEPILEGIPGVASAAVNGGRLRQINVVVDPEKAQARGVTSSDVANAVSQSNALLPSGELISKKFDANVTTNAVAKAVADIGDAPVKSKHGRTVLIGDVAKVEDGGAPETERVTVGGTAAVYLNVLRVPGGNTIEIVDAVRKVVDDLKASKKLPEGIQVEPVFDQSTFVRTTYGGLKREVVQALFLISVVILIFLQSGRSVLIAALAIPISFAAILIVLYATGNTLNAFTLGGLTLAMGPLVDISVVVLESVHRHRKMADAAHNHPHANDPDVGGQAGFAALEGTRAVAVPALAATLTTMAVLLPVLLLFGLAKKLFAPLALTVATAMVAGYIVSMTVTPVACKFLLKHDHEPGRLAQFLEHKIHGLASIYGRMLRAALGYRLVVVGCVFALVVGSAMFASRLPSTFFPAIDESMDTIYVRTAPGMSLEESATQVAAMGQAIRDGLPKGVVDVVLTDVGVPAVARSALYSPNSGPHMGFIRLSLSDPESRTMTQTEISDRARAILNEKFPGTETLQAPGGLVASVFSNGYLAPLVIEVGADNLDQLTAQARKVADVARKVEGVRDVQVTLQADYPELRVETDRQLAGQVGVTSRNAAQTTLEATVGNINTPSVWIDASNGQSYYVVTAYNRDIVDSKAALASMPVRLSDTGAAVPLGAYGKVTRNLAPIAVERSSLQRVAHIYMQTEGRDLGTAAADLEKALHDDPSTATLEWRFVGQIALMRTTFGGLGTAILLAVMVVFMIMASQFKSLRLPFVMLFTIPASLVGIVLALLAAGEGFSITALMGMLMVIGIAVSNGILLVDEANVRLKGGAAPLEAVVGAATVRVIPILMTSLATIVGLLPTALGLDPAAASNRPLALAVVGGLTSSTALSLFLVPAMFLFVVGARGGRRDQGGVR